MIRLNALLLLLFLVIPANAQHDNPSVEPVETERGVILRVRNPGPGTISVSVKTSASGATVHPNPAIVVCPAGQTRDASLVRHGNDPWSYKYSFQWLFGDYQAQHEHEAYRLPFESGESFEVYQGYNGKISHFGPEKYALDFSMAVGTPVVAARGGQVVSVKDDSNRGGPTAAYKEYGNFIRILHEDGTVADYYHFRQYGVEVALGQQVAEGQLLGYSGNTGHSTGPHLHFMVYRPGVDGATRDPIPVLFLVAGQEQPVELKEGESYRAR